MIQGIQKRSEILADMPNTGKKRDEFFKGVRSVTEGNYVIFYKKIPDGILVIRVVHCKRDLDQLFLLRRALRGWRIE